MKGDIHDASHPLEAGAGDGSLATWKDFAAESGPACRYRVTLLSRRAGIAIVSEAGLPLLLGHVAETMDDGPPSETQLKEFGRILALGTRAFTVFCLSHGDFRRDAAPDLPRPGEPPGAPGTRRTVEALLLDHPMMRDEDGLFRFAWAPVVAAPDRSGRFEDDNDPRFDDRWEAEKRAAPEMVERCELWAGNRFLDGWDDDDDEDRRLSFDAPGRGWIVLCGWAGPEGGSSLGFRGLDDLGRYLRSLPKAELRRFHGLIAGVDRDVSATDAAVSYYFAQMRGMCECDWREEEQRARLLPRARGGASSERSVPPFMPGAYGRGRRNRPSAPRGRRSHP